jgi:RNA polymerase subunit RPABC4/transcription elongation factor Spt4
MFRCPKCGQAHEMKWADTVLTQNKEMTKIFVNGTEAENVQVTPTLEVTCNNCNETNTVEEWFDAFAEPLKYFEMEHGQLCHCGGELWMDQIPMTSSYGFVCEKCEWVKPNQKVSGA